MGIYRNQAIRVVTYIAEQCSMSVADLAKTLKINVDDIEKQIIKLHSETKLNGKKCADLLIRHWEASNPEYISDNYPIVFTFKPEAEDVISVRMKQLPEEVLTFYQGPKGDYLHSFKFSGVLTDDIKVVVCQRLLSEYKQQTDNLKS